VALLLQPYGFEGFLLAGVRRPGSESAVENLEHVPVDYIDRDAATPSDRREMHLYQDGVAEVAHFHRLGVDALPCLRLHLDELGHSLRPSKQGTLQLAAADERRSPVSIWPPEFRYRRGVLPIERLEEPPHNLHVLLRHRLLLQAHGFDGGLLGAKVLKAHDLPVAKLEHAAN
jgi:hypothetical protein